MDSQKQLDKAYVRALKAVMRHKDVAPKHRLEAAKLYAEAMGLRKKEAQTTQPQQVTHDLSRLLNIAEELKQ